MEKGDPAWEKVKKLTSLGFRLMVFSLDSLASEGKYTDYVGLNLDGDGKDWELRLRHNDCLVALGAPAPDKEETIEETIDDGDSTVYTIHDYRQGALAENVADS